MAPDETRDFAEVGLTYARAVSGDLAGLMGVEVALKGPSVEYLEKSELLGSDDPVGYAACTSQEAEEESLLFVVPRPEAATLASLLMGQSEERIAELRNEPLDEETLDGFNEVLNLSSAVLSRLFTDEFSLPAVKLSSTAAEMDSPALDKGWLAPGSYHVARYKLIIPGFPEGKFDLVLSQQAAENWFGLATKGDGGRAKAAGSADIEEGEAGEEVAEPITLVVIDSLEADRNVLEDLEDDLGHSVWALDPEET